MATKPRTWRSTHVSEYAAIKNAIGRCHNPEHQSYQNYGARGITVCQEWRDDPDKFWEYLGPKDDPSLTLERLDNQRGYEPGNVAWVSRSANQRNRRKNRTKEFDCFDTYTHKGETRTFVEWATLASIGVPALRQRWHRGLRGDELLAPRQRACVEYITFNNERMSIFTFANRVGIFYETAYRRIKKHGLTPEQVAAGETKPRSYWKVNVKTFLVDGVPRTIRQLVDESGLTDSTIRGRVHRGINNSAELFAPPSPALSAPRKGSKPSIQ